MLRNAFSPWKLDPHTPPRNANNIEPYTFVTLFSGKFDTPHPHLHYVTLEWPLIWERTYVSRYLCSSVPMFPEPMFPGAYVPRYLCSPVVPVPMFPGLCTLIVVISINRLQILPTPWYDSRLGLCLRFRFRVLVRVRVRVRLVTNSFSVMVRMWIGVKPLRLT